jgi:hypothetical protein
MQSNYNAQMTPPRRTQSKEMESTGEKMNMQDRFVESKIEFNGQSKEEHIDVNGEKESANKLDEIEGEIRKLARRLEDIQLEEIEETDKYSDRFLDLQGERANINKALADLDFDHKVECAKLIRESRRKGNEEREKRAQ